MHPTKDFKTGRNLNNINASFLNFLKRIKKHSMNTLYGKPWVNLYYLMVKLKSKLNVSKGFEQHNSFTILIIVKILLFNLNININKVLYFWINNQKKNNKKTFNEGFLGKNARKKIYIYQITIKLKT
ncbi:hypothetical protein BpHYR1_050520 [Brachionus plicatilis]|uniref:Uncharacterized protein n=1 Tax=Brachionus plicatilis TaxID=10195 RepID=A0A3M7P9L9_BRAPC|nr:hypothetical protein BpHYR1_050520 [Brachionus plicatilis]